MTDQQQNPQAPPPQGGGTQTTDPTFANQSKSAPKENKPAKKADMQPKR